MRYSQEGILDQTSENILSMDSTRFEVSLESLRQEMAVRHQSMMVGIGLVFSDRGIRLIEVFADRYVQAGSVFHEPKPRPLSLAELGATYSYSLPDDERVLRPTLPDGLRYASPDGGTGEVEMQDQHFSCPIPLGKVSGVYTVRIWVQRKFDARAFLATNISIFVE